MGIIKERPATNKLWLESNFMPTTDKKREREVTEDKRDKKDKKADKRLQHA